MSRLKKIVYEAIKDAKQRDKKKKEDGTVNKKGMDQFVPEPELSGPGINNL